MLKELFEEIARDEQKHFDSLDPVSYTHLDVYKRQAYEISGPKIEKMLGYTNMDSEKGFAFFQRFLREQGIIKELENMGIEDGDTVRMYDFEFDYYK